MTPHLVLSVFNVGNGISLGAELSGDFGTQEASNLSQVELEVRGDLRWDVDRQLLEQGRVVAIVLELEGGDRDYSVDLTDKVNRAIFKNTRTNVIRLM